MNIFKKKIYIYIVCKMSYNVENKVYQCNVEQTMIRCYVKAFHGVKVTDTKPCGKKDSFMLRVGVA